MKIRYTIATVIIVAIILLLGGCATGTPTAVPPTEPAPQPASEPYAYGDDPTLDALYDRCSRDDIDACDELYWTSPLGSRYEKYGLDRTIELEKPDVPVNAPDDIDPAVLLDIAWELSLTESDRRDICDGIDALGYDVGGRILAESSGWAVSAADASAWLRTKC